MPTSCTHICCACSGASCCGCTAAEISADVIPPGKAVTIELVYDAGFHDTAGQTVRRGLIIESNDPDQPQAEIWVQADVAQN